ncbi:MAG: hypothetical protein QM535_16090 [Limnohabitans sp.]|nr:hypothetical protein [Limnohabitans sp.]
MMQNNSLKTSIFGKYETKLGKNLPNIGMEDVSKYNRLSVVPHEPG